MGDDYFPVDGVFLPDPGNGEEGGVSMCHWKNIVPPWYIGQKEGGSQVERVNVEEVKRAKKREKNRATACAARKRKEQEFINMKVMIGNMKAKLDHQDQLLRMYTYEMARLESLVYKTKRQ